VDVWNPTKRTTRTTRTTRNKRNWRIVAVLLTMAASVAVVWPTPSVAAANSVALTRYPYVTDVVGNSARINWGTDRSQSTGSATWGVVSGGTCTPTNTAAATKISITVGSTGEYQWTAPIAFPGSGTYCYRVQLGTTDLLGTDSSPQVTTAAAPGSSYSFAVLGDYGAGTTFEANVMSQIAVSPAKFVVTVGDNVYNSGTDTEYGDLSQGNFFPKQYLPMLGSRAIFAAEGNHGFTQNLPYLQNLSALTAAQASGGKFVQESYCCISTLSSPTNYPSAWYAFDWGSVRYYVLDGAWADGTGAYQGDFLAHWNGPVSGCAACGAELSWLRSDLATHASTPIKFAFFHYPLYSDNSSQNSDTYLQGPNSLEGLLANNGVDIVFNGHAHLYERNNPQIAGKPLVSYVTGTGGAPLEGASNCSAFDAYAIGSGSACRAPQPASDANVYGFLLVTVNGDQVTVTPTDSTGRTFDVQTYTYSTTPTTYVAVPSNGATLSGTSAGLDAGASNATSVQFLITGGSYSNHVIGTATQSIYGWIYNWNTTTVPNGSYTLRSEAFNSSGSAFSANVSITVNNPLPTTYVAVPSNGATLSGTSAGLDAGASNATSVQFLITGGSYSNQVIGTATLSAYGWIYYWNTTTVPNGSYTLRSEAFNSAGSAFSANVSITVHN
jgi:Calcineurin-like phosphoesterase/Bacterial Ig domain